jgi:hypothetical protein
MSDWFVSRHTKFLEAELVRLRSEVADLKKTHAEELSRAISDVQYHRDEIERLRRFLFPGMAQSYDTVREASSPAAPELVPDKFAGLTPFQRLAAKDLEQQDLEIARKKNTAESTAA